MRKSTVIATFFVVGAGATGAAALNFKGSDTLFDFTNDEIAACGSACAGLVYLGTGSGNGESAMKSGTQTIAPMSRFLQSGVCTTSSAVADAGLVNAQGLVVGLDGVGVFGATNTAGTSTCNGAAGTDCSKTAAGLAYDTTITDTNGNPYTFTSWKDVLSVVYGGRTHDGVNDCNSPVRRSIASNWSSLFETACAVNGSGCINAEGNAPQLQHAFRRDDGSGTSDVFASVLGLSPSVAAPQASNFNAGVSPYCNVVQPRKTITSATSNASTQIVTVTTSAAHGLTTNQYANVYYNGPVGWATQPATAKAASGGFQVTVIDATTFSYHCNPGLTCPTGSATGGVFYPLPVGVGLGIIPTDHQDNDPIRRTCVGTSAGPNAASASEDVCDLGGTDGLVLPVVPVDFIQGGAAAQYPTNFCGANPVIKGNPPRYHNPLTGVIISGGQCPNGHGLVGGTVCLYDSSASSACLERKTGGIENAYGSYTTNTASGTSVGSVDPRLWNAYLGRSFPAGTTSVTQYFQNDLLNRDILGAYYRIHSKHTLVPGATAATPVCQQNDATQQLGCLATASPCSLAYAGREADQVAGNTSIRVNQVVPLTACIQLFGQVNGVDPGDGGPLQFAYPFSRKLYLNSIVGFNNVTDNPGQQGLVQFESTNVNTALLARNFVVLPDSGPNNVNGGLPFCEDFNEQTVCALADGGSPANVNSCLSNVAPYPTANTVCGNMVVEPLEECDNGTANINNGPAGSCSLSCRIN